MSKLMLSKHRFKELQHFCLQYPEWVKLYSQLNTGFSKSLDDDPTERVGIQRADYARNIELVSRVAQSDEILLAVTTPWRPKDDLDVFYEQYRQFFLMLDKEKGI